MKTGMDTKVPSHCTSVGVEFMLSIALGLYLNQALLSLKPFVEYNVYPVSVAIDPEKNMDKNQWLL